MCGQTVMTRSTPNVPASITTHGSGSAIVTSPADFCELDNNVAWKTANASQAVTTNRNVRRMADLSLEVGDSPRPRRDPHPLTREFSNSWPALEQALLRWLASRGLDTHDARDIAQEVAVRVLARGHRWTSEEDLRRYCFVIARNLHIDQVRQERHFASAPSPDRPDLASADGFDQVEDRQLLHKVEAVAPQLSATHRAALLDATAYRTASERNRANVARFRARASLRKLVGPLAGVLTPAGALLHRLLAAFRRASVVAVPAALAMLFSMGVFVSLDPQPPLQADLTPFSAYPSAQPSPSQNAQTDSGSRPTSGSAQSVEPGVGMPASPTPILQATAPGRTHFALGTRSPTSSDSLVCIDNPNDPTSSMCAQPPQATQLCHDYRELLDLVCRPESTPTPTPTPAARAGS